MSALLDLKIEVTQATVSRDMRELRLVKVPAKNRGYRYALPESSLANTDTESSQPMLEKLKSKATNWQLEQVQSSCYLKSVVDALLNRLFLQSYQMMIRFY